jgi:hypothetical protein
MSDFIKFKRALIETLERAKKDKVVGPIRLNFSVKGNAETQELEMKEVAEHICTVHSFIVKSFIVYYDEGWSKIVLNVYDMETIEEYIDKTEKILEAAKNYIDESPCDYDITKKQNAAWRKYQKLLKK